MPITPDEILLRELHGRVSAELDRVLGEVGPGDPTRPTPCTRWTLHQLLEHHAAQNDALAWALTGGGPELERWRPRALADPVAAVVATSNALRALLADDRVWDRRVWMPEISEEVTFTTARVVTFHFLDTLAHAWDVAAAIGADLQVDRDVLRLARDVAGQVPGGAARTAAGAAFGPALPAGAPNRGLDTILRLLGRDPLWQPQAVAAR